MRGKGTGRLRSDARTAAKRAAGMGGVDAADLVLRSGRVARRVELPDFALLRCGVLGAEEPSTGAD